MNIMQTKHKHCRPSTTDQTLRTKHEIRTRLKFYHVLQFSILVRLVGITKSSYRWPYHDCFVTYVQFWKQIWNEGQIWKYLYSKEIILLFQIKCKLLPYIHKTVDFSHTAQNQRKTVDLVTLTKEILNGKLPFFVHCYS